MNSQKWLSINFFTFFFTWGVFMPYWTGYLTNAKGLSVTSASVIMGAGMLARAFSTFALFPRATSKYSMQKVLRLLALLSFAALVLYIPFNSFYSLLTITVLFSLIYPNLLPAMESSASILMQKDKVHYGKSRSFGSVGFMFALLFIGGVTAIWDEQAILWTMLAALAIIMLTYSRPMPASLSEIPLRTTKENSVKWKELFTSKQFIIILTLTVLIQGSHASYNNYGFIYLQDIGVNSLYIGIILNVAVIFEIVFFLIADKLFSNKKVSWMFLLAGIGATIRWIGIYLFPSVWMFILTQALHSVSFGVAHYAFIQYISRTLDKRLIPAAQGIYAALSMSLSSAVLTLAGGYLYDIEPKLAFLGMAFCTVPAIILIVLSRKKFSY
ncbi:MFS transporter [Psychrobacillus sp. MER TA 171]|uniref:MFS transporter n=1 Tax=Psychrobacillus sp. MER TA 171 TaxID=2939577 RepID=UPI00203F792A|nr:MFS transporter [Psychrobacillus sp. MER TA 171]MCM3357611.1 MFS transporter [Psychrobacillus sp. MER TA 171]